MSPASEPRVLLVDDDPHVLSALRRCLKREKVAVETAANAQAALDFLAQTTIDLVVSDQKMPGMSGTELCERVVANRPDVPVVVMTAFGSLETAVAQLIMGARAVVGGGHL